MAPTVVAAARPGLETAPPASLTADPALAENRKSFVRTSKLARIRGRCLNCVEGHTEVRACAFFSCPLWAFRMGKNPFPLSEAQLERNRKGRLNSPLAVFRSGDSSRGETVDGPPSLGGEIERAVAASKR